MNLRDLVRLARGTAMLPDPLPRDPVPLLAAWLDAARAAGDQPNPNAMVLATTDDDGPDARVVLLKGLDPAPGGGLVFYTNRESPKARQLEAAGRAAAVLHWDHVARQVRVRGLVERASDAESDAYFASRPLLSRIGAWTSRQSRPLESRRALVREARAVARRFGVPLRDLVRERSDVPVPRPPHWGGYRLRPLALELWCGADGRLHDRARWTRATAEAPWDAGTRLQP